MNRKVIAVVLDDNEATHGGKIQLPVATLTEEQFDTAGDKGCEMMAKQFASRNGHTYVETLTA